MPLTSRQMLNVLSSTLAFYVKDKGSVAQHIQDKPLLRSIDARKKMFAAGALRQVKAPAIFETESTVQPYELDDTVTYSEVNVARQVEVQYATFHIGLQVTEDELMQMGVKVEDEGRTSANSGDVERLRDGLRDKLDDQIEGFAKDMNGFYWADGSASPKAFQGIMAYVQDDPTIPAMVAGIDQSTEPRWRNRAVLNISTTTPANMTIFQTLLDESRQLRRFGGKPNCAFAGETFLQKLNAEFIAKGSVTMNGWQDAGTMNVGMADPRLSGFTIEYDPTLDDIGRSNFLYVLDISSKGLCPFEISGEGRKPRRPGRPHDKYVYRAAMTHACGLLPRRRNSSGVYSVAV